MTTRYEQQRPDGNYFPPTWNEEMSRRRLGNNGAGEQVSKAIQRIRTDVVRIVISSLHVASTVSWVGLSLPGDPLELLGSNGSPEEVDRLLGHLIANRGKESSVLPENPSEQRRALALEFIIDIVREKWFETKGQVGHSLISTPENEDTRRIIEIKEIYKDFSDIEKLLREHFSRKPNRRNRNPSHGTLKL